MDLKQKMDRFYLDMIINELRLAHDSSYQAITYNSLLYLDIIAYHEKCTVSYIAQILHIAKSAVTLKIKELEHLGLVKRTQSLDDKRVFYLSVNEDFLEQYKAYDRVLYQALDQIQKNYSDFELHLFCEILDTINRSFQNQPKP